MTIMRTRNFDHFQESIHGMTGEILLRSKPERDWRVRSVGLPDITLTMVCDAASTIYTGRSSPGVFHCIIPLATQTKIIVDGVRLDRNRLVWLAPGAPFHLVRLAPSRWVDVCIGSSLVEHGLNEQIDPSMSEMVMHNCVVETSGPLTLLLLIMREAFRLDNGLSDDEESTAMRSTLANALVECLFATLSERTSGEMISRRAGRHADILEATLDLIGSSDALMPDTDAMCSVAHTTERTIRNVFNEFFSVSPHRYLMLRRLHSIRRAIRDGRAEENITSICARHNVWDFGRFSGQYRACFGVLPSEDLVDARYDSGKVIDLRPRSRRTGGFSEISQGRSAG